MEGLLTFWDQLQANPILLVVVLVLAIFLFVGLIKRILTIALLSGVLLLLYFVYVTNFQDSFPLPDDFYDGWGLFPGKDDANGSVPVSQ